MSAAEHQASSADDHASGTPGAAAAAAATAAAAPARPRRPSWALLLWVLSAALVASGAALLWQASADGSVDTAQPVSTIRMDPETGRVISCESQGEPCSWTLATDGLAYALALPALGSGTTGLLLGIALRTRQAQQQQPETRRELPQEAHALPEGRFQPRDTPATPPPARSLRDETAASFDPFMPPGHQPGDDPARR